MNKSLQYMLITLLIWLIAAALLWAGLNEDAQQQLLSLSAPYPTLAVALLLCFCIQWLVFIPSYLLQSEHYYDLTGSLTYISLVALCLFNSTNISWPQALIAFFVSIWAVRLGSFLFLRVKKQGQDDRFDKIKPYASRFFMVWNLQGLWVFITLACGLTALTSPSPESWSTTQTAVMCLGAALWVFGFAVEVIADRQKSAFREEHGRSRFIDSGLWSWSRHPNYFGEMVLWLGVALISIPLLQGYQYLTLISPIFVYLLISRISGIPMLESKANKQWGDNEAYQAYKKATSVLVLKPPRKET